MYLSYDDYIYSGGDIQDEAQFDRINYRVERLIDRITFGRVKDEIPVRECVKRLAFELFEIEQARAYSTVAAGVSSMSNDGVSVSYADGNASAASFNSTAQALAVEYLAGEVDANGVCLLYAGRAE